MTLTVRPERPSTRGPGAAAGVRVAVLIAGGGVAVVAAHVLLGVTVVSPVGAWHALTGTADPDLRVLLADVRLPRALLGLAAGATLGVAGLLMQRATRNPLADPGITGVSGGASLAMLLALLVVPSWHIPAPAAALAGGLATAALVSVVSARARTGADLALAGLVISMCLGAIRGGLLLTSSSEQVAATITSWLVGSLSGRSLDDLVTLLPWIAASIIAILLIARRLPMLALDDDVAAALGVRIVRLRLVVIGVAALLTATSVAVAGPIGFIGLAAAHLARIVSRGPATLPLTALVGGVLLCGADLAARTLAMPVELPVGALTGLCVGPLIIVMMRRP